MRKCMLFSVCAWLLLAVACGKVGNESPKPENPEVPEQPEEPVEPAPVIPETETVITIGAIPDSILVETGTKITFSVQQEEHPEEFKVEVKSILPVYRTDFIVGTDTAQADIHINDKEPAEITTLKNGEENTVSFDNPNAVGEYIIHLTITDKYDRETQDSIKIKVYSPEIIIEFFDYFPGFDEDTYYEDLNQKFSHSPLSQELIGKQTDTIFTQECFMSVLLPDGTIGYDSVTTTVPGQGIVCYIEQEGGGDFVNTSKKWGTTSWGTRMDGELNIHLRRIKPGFHGIMFETARTGIGVEYYTIFLIDRWGKEASATIAYRSFGIKENIPEYCTPSDDEGWWYHPIGK